MEEIKKYITSKEECRKHIKGVCESCGGELEPIETEDNSGNPTFWVGCKHCQKFRWGIDKMYFDIARELVVKGEIIPYQYNSMNSLKEINKEYWIEEQTSSLSHSILLIHNMIKEKLKQP